jgi:hypothetical protein
VVALLVALRLVALALRDWRMPIFASSAGAAILGFGGPRGGGPIPGWRPALVLVVPLFFAAGLASRASTVWSGPEGEDRPGRAGCDGRSCYRALGLAMATAVALAVRAVCST